VESPVKKPLSVGVPKLPVRFEYDDNGKLHIHFDGDTELHFHGTKSEVIEDSSVEFIHGDKIIITSGVHHVNPWGAEFYDQILNNIIENDTLREVMEAKLKLHKEQEVNSIKANRSLSLREKLFKRIMKKGKKCSCG